MIPALVIAIPLLAAVALAVWPGRDWGNLAASALGFALACCLPWVTGDPGGWLAASPATIHLVLLNSFVGVAGAWQPASADRPLLHHTLFQALLGSTNLALLADNTVVTWVALQAAALALALATLRPNTLGAGQAAWRVLLLTGAALIVAALGTLLLYLAAIPALGTGGDALRWSTLAPSAARCDGTMLSLAFALLLLGYGGLAGLAPLHNWLLDGSAAFGGALGGAVPGVALLIILRLRAVLDGNAQAISPGGPIMAMGLAALLLSGIGLWRTADARRWLALSSVGQNGVAAFAFGLGGAAATLAGLLHLTAHTLVKAAAFLALERQAGRVAVMVLAGLPPFGLFVSLVLVTQLAVQRSAWLAAPLGVGIASGAAAMLVRLPGLTGNGWPGSAGAWACLAAALAVGLAMPAALGDWFEAVAAVAQ